MAGEIQSTFVSFGELRPDSGEFNNRDLVEAIGVLPLGDVYFPLQPLYSRSDTIGPGVDPVIVRGHVNKNPPGGGPGKSYVAVDGSIYAINTSPDPWTVTLLVAGLTIDGDGGQFCGFGSHEIFACGNSQPMQLRDLGAGAMVDCITDSASPNDPRPKYVCQIGERILIGNIGNCVNAGVGTPDHDPELVWWSATRNPRTFGTAASHPDARTGYNSLHDDSGPITGMVGGKEYALIFKRRGVYRMDFGGAYGFTFRAIPQAYGCVSHLSICALGRDVYFWSDCGPCVYRDDQVIPLAYGKLALDLLETKRLGVNQNPSIIGSGADSVNNLLWWVFTYVGEGGGYRMRKLTYSPMTDRFSYAFDQALSPTMLLADAGGTPAAANVVACWDGRNDTGLPFCGGVFAVNDYQSNELRLWTYSGELGDHWWQVGGSLKTGFFPLSPKGSARIQRVRPVVVMKSGATIPDLSVTIYTKAKPWDDPTASGPYYLGANGDGRGFIVVNDAPSSQFVQIQLNLPALSDSAPIETNPYSSLREIEGIYIEYVLSGDKL